MARARSQPDALGSVLDRSLGRGRLASVLVEAALLSRWEEAVGPQVAARARPDGLRDGVLTLRVASAPWMAELSFLKPKLLGRINAAVGARAAAPLVVDLRLLPGRLPPLPARPAPPHALPPLSAEQGRMVDEITREVADPILRDAIGRALARALVRRALVAGSGDAVAGRTEADPDR